MDKKGVVRTLIALVIVVVIIVIAVWTIYYYMPKNNKHPPEIQTPCADLGCLEDSVYVGSVNSDKYYSCDCHYAERILPENILCFGSDEEAQANGYIKVEC